MCTIWPLAPFTKPSTLDQQQSQVHYGDHRLPVSVLLLDKLPKSMCFTVAASVAYTLIPWIASNVPICTQFSTLMSTAATVCSSNSTMILPHCVSTSTKQTKQCGLTYRWQLVQVANSLLHQTLNLDLKQHICTHLVLTSSMISKTSVFTLSLLSGWNPLDLLKVPTHQIN